MANSASPPHDDHGADPGAEARPVPRDYAPGRPLVFSHIPKTAGTSLRAALSSALEPEVYVQGMDVSLLGGYDDLDTVHPRLRTGIYTAPEKLPADATLVAGHIAPSTTMRRYPGADHITVLRSPQVRILSVWLHSRSLSDFDVRHWGSSAASLLLGRRPLRDALLDPMVAPVLDNTITRFLAWPHPLLSPTAFIAERDDEELLAAALSRLDSFQYVSLVEHPHLLADLSTWLGRRLPPTRLNERTAVPRRLRPDLDTELAASAQLVAERSRLDTRLWDSVAVRLLPDRDPALVREQAMHDAVSRYAAMLAAPAPAPPARRLVEWAYARTVSRRRKRPYD